MRSSKKDRQTSNYLSSHGQFVKTDCFLRLVVLRFAANIFGGFGAVAIHRYNHCFSIRIQQNNRAFESFLLFIRDIPFPKETKKTASIVISSSVINDIFNICYRELALGHSDSRMFRERQFFKQDEPPGKITACRSFFEDLSTYNLCGFSPSSPPLGISITLYNQLLSKSTAIVIT